MPVEAAHSDGPESPQGGPGHTHEAGPGQKRGFTRRERWFAAVVLLLSVIMSAGSLVSQQIEQVKFQNSQAAAGRMTQSKLCATLVPLASLKPPPGASSATPARVYEVQQAQVLARLSSDLDCKK